ncbi:MAG: copper chaperone PCu(A)C [Gammaproteobacteria bacterium]|nr:copper chaperone PCu(A)C [Gammaproteobacteria bacterium]MBV9724343.1 copper chaperone PCu(A)C [Gammaproteobacteria bacterium]
MRVAALLAVSLVTLGSAMPALGSPPALTAQDAWIRATPGVDVAAAYVTLHNSGTQPVVVSGVRAADAEAAMIHETTIVNGQSAMRAHETLRIAPGETVRLAPGGLHIMLQGLKRALSAGDEVPLVLLLQGGGSLTVMARVRALADA